jgi:pimeloyl-ACP methyl ester carboxylesterase
MGLFRNLKLPKMHLIGHHSGAALSMEMASVYPEEFHSVALSGPALATPEEQAAMFKTIAYKWSEPEEDGSHLMKVWNLMSANDQLWNTLELKNHEVIDSLRAWKGRNQAYGVMFRQEKLKYYKSITIPLLSMCSKEDVLWPCFHFCKELVSLDSFVISLSCADIEFLATRGTNGGNYWKLHGEWQRCAWKHSILSHGLFGQAGRMIESSRDIINQLNW